VGCKLEGGIGGGEERQKRRTRKPEGHGCPDEATSAAVGYQDQMDSFTSHIFLTFKDYKAVAAVRFMFFVWFLVGMCISNDADLNQVSGCKLFGRGPTYALNRAKAPKLAFEILFISIVVKTRHYQCLESVTADVGILVRVN
jgi:hypothetical protein